MDKSSPSQDDAQHIDSKGSVVKQAINSERTNTQHLINTEQTKNQHLIDNVQQWQSLSAWSIVNNIFSTLKNILSNGFAIVPIVYTGWQQGFDMQWGLLASSVLFLLVTMFAIIEWRTFRFRVNHDQLEVKRGLLFTKKDEIPLSRIQNIRYEQPFYFRPLSLGTLVIETAGSKKDEAHLAAVDMHQAQRLKSLLLNLGRADLKQSNLTHSDLSHTDTAASILLAQAGSKHQNSDNNLDNTQPMVRKSLADLVLFGFYQNNFIWFAVIAGPIAGQVDWDKIFNTPLAQQFWLWVQQQTQQNIGLQTIMAIITLLVIYSLFSLISIIAAILKYYPYQLDKHDDTLQRSGGVISHQQDSLAIKRIQLVHVQQPITARLFNRWTLYFKQVNGHDVEQKNQQHMLIPSVKPSEVEPLLANMPQLSGGATALPDSYTAIHINWLTKRIILPLFSAILLSIMGYVGHHSLGFFELLWSITAMMMLAIYIRYKQWGYVVTEQVIWQHSGFLGQQWQRIAYEKIQHVKITQTQAQKQARLASVDVGLASGNVMLPYIPAQVAELIIARTLNVISHDDRNWI